MNRLIKRSKGSGKTDFEINIVPIVDCLTILVTFMLAAGAYYSLAMLDIKVSGSAASVEDPAHPPVDLTVELKPNQNLILKISGEVSRRVEVRTAEDLVRELGGIHEKWPEVNAVTLIANKEVPYQNVVAVLESIRRSHPDVILGGF